MSDSQVIEKIKIIKEAIRNEENAIFCTNSHKKKMERQRNIEFLNWRLAQIRHEQTRKKAQM